MMRCTRISMQAKSFLFSSGCHQVHVKGPMPTIILFKSPPRLCCFTGIPARSANRSSRISVSNAPSFSSLSSSSCSLRVLYRTYYSANISKTMRNYPLVVGKTLSNTSAHEEAHVDFLVDGLSGSRMIALPSSGINSRFKCSRVKPLSWSLRLRRIFSGLAFGILVCYCSSSDSVYAEAPKGDHRKEQKNLSSMNMSHGKPVYTDYSVIGIPGDGRCLFQSVAHGACLRSGTAPPSESLQRELADELRARVADEFIKRREETEWFIEGDFDSYVERMRKPHVWGGEPELLMLSHVLRMPITVYMHDENAGGLISIAEYGQDHGNKENPIRVLYHGFGHYDALHIPGMRGAQSKL